MGNLLLRLINAVEDRFTRIEDALISYKGGYNTGTEQQHTCLFEKDCYKFIKGRITELENHFKQKKAVNDFFMSALKTNSISSKEKRLLIEPSYGSNNSRTELPSQ